MAMSGGRDDGSPMMDLNMTPMIDVLLVLLILFIMTIPAQTHAVKVDLPVNTNQPAPPVEPQKNKIIIYADDRMTWNGTEITSDEQLAQYLEATKAIDPEPELAKWWDAATSGPGTSRKVAQLPISWDTDQDAAIERAHQLFRWSLGGWKVNAELPSPAAFADSAQTARPEDVAQAIPCGSDVGAVVTAGKKFFDAGYTDLALVQVGADAQDSFFAAAMAEILPELRAQFK